MWIIRYASICAMETTSKLDDEQWLAYWIIYSFITLFEMAAQNVLYWYVPYWIIKPTGNVLQTVMSKLIPLWYEAKLLLVAWLVLPQFRGASFIYDKLVREQLRKHGVRLHGHGAEHEPHVVNLKVCNLSASWIALFRSWDAGAPIRKKCMFIMYRRSDLTGRPKWFRLGTEKRTHLAPHPVLDSDTVGAQLPARVPVPAPAPAVVLGS
ncbi:hypothetical protein HU200_037706 [Digitaria exilis]|uniref:HVA22-like protein n=1 Tax=Digitaria exilis TaxID=1010633 RepID=A0A835EH04_9POAL|nr:hypothetical protein HU200_037706 [Digitaria exilis]